MFEIVTLYFPSTSIFESSTKMQVKLSTGIGNETEEIELEDEDEDGRDRWR